MILNVTLRIKKNIFFFLSLSDLDPIDLFHHIRVKVNERFNTQHRNQSYVKQRPNGGTDKS
jgi:hypothetical protein